MKKSSKTLPKKKKITIKQLSKNIEIKEIKSLPKNNKQRIQIREKAFIKVFQSKSNFSPVLNKIQTSQRNIDLEEIAKTAPQPKKDEQEKDKRGEFSYLSQQGKKDEAKYSSAESIEYAQPKKFFHEQMTDKKRDIFETPKVNFIPMQKPTAEQQMYEQYAPVERFDMDKERKKDPFKKPEVKYSPSKY